MTDPQVHPYRLSFEEITRMTSKNKITKIPNSEKNSKRKGHNQMAKSKAQTPQTNG